jgi:hypothetical protein
MWRTLGFRMDEMACEQTWLTGPPILGGAPYVRITWQYQYLTFNYSDANKHYYPLSSAFQTVHIQMWKRYYTRNIKSRYWGGITTCPIHKDGYTVLTIPNELREAKRLDTWQVIPCSEKRISSSTTITENVNLFITYKESVVNLLYLM